jgi:hypothetical protein
METKLIKKQIGQKNYNVKKIITDPEYLTSDEEFLLVQNTVKKVILNNAKLKEHIRIIWGREKNPKKKYLQTFISVKYFKEVIILF